MRRSLADATSLRGALDASWLAKGRRLRISGPHSHARAWTSNEGSRVLASDVSSDARIEEAAVTQRTTVSNPPTGNVRVTAGEFSDGTKGYRRRCRSLKIEGCRGCGPPGNLTRARSTPRPRFRLEGSSMRSKNFLKILWANHRKGELACGLGMSQAILKPLSLLHSLSRRIASSG
jgi:hypothetical protein